METERTQWQESQYYQFPGRRTRNLLEIDDPILRGYDGCQVSRDVDMFDTDGGAASAILGWTCAMHSYIWFIRLFVAFFQTNS